jgi:hypothetical protein
MMALDRMFWSLQRRMLIHSVSHKNWTTGLCYFRIWVILYFSIILCVECFNLVPVSQYIYIYIQFYNNYTVSTLRHVSATIFDHHQVVLIQMNKWVCEHNANIFKLRLKWIMLYRFYLLLHVSTFSRSSSGVRRKIKQSSWIVLILINIDGTIYLLI